MLCCTFELQALTIQPGRGDGAQEKSAEDHNVFEKVNVSKRVLDSISEHALI